MQEKKALQEVIDEIIEPKLAEIRHEADELVTAYKAAIRAENARRPDYDDHAKLTPYITKNPNGYVYVYWSRFHGWRTEGNRRLRNTKHLKTTQGGDYSENLLRRYAQEWEMERIIEAERKFKALRKKQTHLGEARMSLTNLIVSIY